MTSRTRRSSSPPNEPTGSQAQLLATPLPVQVGDTWRYFKGTTAPPSSWNTAGFNDSGWSQGPGGFGYGPDCTAQRNTILTDMQNPPSSPGYLSLYTRRLFSVANPSSIGSLELTVDYDDGFIAYLNGTEVARSVSMGGTVGTPVSNTATATSRECSSCDGGSCNAAQTFTMSAGSILSGDNVLAIEGHNRSLDSSDFTLVATLRAVEPPNPPPTPPTDPESPQNGASGVSLRPTLCVAVDDPDHDPLSVSFFGRQAGSAPDEDFTIIALPDTQFYSQNYPQIFNQQTQWIKDNRAARNIVFVTQLGDCTNDGDTGGQEYQWTNADAAISILEGATTPQLPAGIPYGIAIGNHDNTSNARAGSDEGGSTVQYTKVFGLQRSCPGTCSNNSTRACSKDSTCTSPGICNPGTTCRGYFGGRYDFGAPSTYYRNTDNHYELFSASGMDFIIFHLEWDNPTDASPANNPVRTAVLNWVHALMDPVTGPYRDRRAIVTAHYFLDASGSFSGQGQHTYNALKDLPNVFLMLAGHRDQAVDRADPAVDGHTIRTLMSDYQTRPNGGDGWLRIMTFSPQNDSIHIETYSPFIEGGRFINKPTRHADDQPTNPNGNELTFAYDMDSGLPWQSLGTLTNVQSGTTACLDWPVPPDLPAGTPHEWYVTLNDSHTTVRSATWVFTTTQTCATNADCDDRNACNGLESCQGSHCAPGTALTCNDNNPCTDDSCNRTTGCVYTPDDTNACGDGNACNGLETCVAGNCAGSAAPNCNDGNPCTDDSCAPASGCVHGSNTEPCNDGSACTTSDACTGGQCRGNYAPFPGCCATDTDCDDGNRSTTDTCTGGGCTNPPNLNCESSDECDDGQACTTDACFTDNVAALDFDGTDDYVSMGAAAKLNSSPRFTIETWFKWDGGGVTTSTGNGGITAIPLVTKGRADAETPANRNMNYFLGIFLSSGNGRLAADFEDAATGLNHPVCASLLSPAITTGVWHHAAVAYDYDGTVGSWRLTMDGEELPIDTSCSTCVGAACTTTPAAVPEPLSIQPFALGTALIVPTGTETPGGFFDGKLDEVRVWRVARTLAQIQAGKPQQITSDPDLLGRWGLNEGSGKTAGDSDPDGDGTFYNGALEPDSPPGNVPGWITGGDNLPPLGIGTCTHTPLNCDDGDSCTADFCTAGTCGHTPAANGVACNDGNPCTTSDGCLGGSCRGTYAPSPGCCASGEDCDDRAAGTTDTCSAQHNCSNTLTPCNITSECSDNHPCTSDSCAGGNPWSLDFDGTNDYVSMGAAPGLNSSPRFTIETWFRWDGGTATNATTTGTGGITAIPLVTKGRAQAETPANLNTNYFLGIYLTGTAGRLAADFEDSVSGLNHPVCAALSTPAITTGVWHHAAAVYDYNTTTSTGAWQIILDGAALAIDTACSTCTGAACTTTPAAFPEPNSIQRFALGSALRSESSPEQPLGFFDGRLDEVRVWRTARTLAQIQAGMNLQITSDTNLLGRWGLNDGPPAGTAVDSNPNGDSTTYTGTLLPAANPPTWAPSGGPVTGTCSRTPIAGCCAASDECIDSDRCTTDACVGSNASALDFDGTDDYVSMGVAAGLNASPRFTVETWFNWDGGGVTAGTGNGGITAIPIVSKGRADMDAPANLNLNYFLGIYLSGGSGRIAADFEDAASGLNHPVCAALSTPAITTGVWHHVAIVYDYNATTSTGAWQIVLDGAALTVDTACSTCVSPSCTTTPAAFPEPNSSEHFALATSLQAGTTDSPLGYFSGKLDEIRVWRIARTLAQIQAGRSVQIASDPNLLGRWGLNEGAGGTAFDSDPNADATGYDGTLSPSYPNNVPSWVPEGGDLPEIATGSCTHTLSGLCCATDAECGDGNTCTTDACVNGTCTHANNFSPCNDGNACTTNDTCSGGSCRGGAAPDCSDGNACTDDVCNPSSGCAHPNNTAPCTDGNACTADDRCSGGICRSGAATDCDDDNVCTGDSCTPSSGCGYVNLSGACNDGNACTTNDQCIAGICRGGAGPNCDDGNVCTDDACNPTSGCTHANNTAPCTDGNACTTNDLCAAGICRAGAVRNCNDGNVCTDDSCVPSSGCVNANNTAPCTDGNACTANDRCSAGSCLGGAATNCNDNNPCTDDTCGPTGCVHANNTQSCNDGSVCTTNDQCATGTCRGGAALNCDDGNVCTDDTCNAASGCGHANNTATCTDGNACTANDRCSAGSCLGGAPTNCSDNNPCTDDTCGPTGCVHTNNTNACDDGNACTTNTQCSAGSCSGIAVVCTAIDQCHTAGTCAPSTGSCSNPNKANGSACNDGNACTSGESCQNGACTGGTGGASSLNVRVNEGKDDAEERSVNSMSLGSSDLELVNDGGTIQKVGMLFQTLGIPRAATITAAWIQFRAKETQSETTALTIQAQAIDNAPDFSSGNISSRIRTSASVSWSPDPWTVTGETGPKQKTPDLRSVIQEVVNRGGWASGHDLAILVTGSGHRTAYAYDGGASSAPLLHVEWGSCGGPTNQAPNGLIDTPTGSVRITAGQSVNFTGSPSDPDGPTSFSFLWDFGGGAPNRTVEDPGSTAFPTPGTFTVTFTVRDGQGLADSTPDTRVITVDPVGGAVTTLERRIVASSDDAEQRGSGVELTSSDLELVDDGDTRQTVGLRFTNITIPKGRTIQKAYIQFQADETQSDTTNLTLQIQAIDSALTFQDSTNNISSRSRTGSVAWSSVPSWGTIGQAGADQRTPDIKSLIQAVVDRPGWSSGNALAIIITGTGHRTAEAFDGDLAPLLHIEY